MRTIGNLSAIALGVALAVACGTGAPPASGDKNLPNALAGPFRPLRAPDEGTRAPFVIAGATVTDPSALDLDGDEKTLGVALFVELGNEDFPHAISRFDLPDGPESPAKAAGGMKVLIGDQDWEHETIAGVSKPTVHKPFVLRVGAEVWLYYEAGGCIGRATSPDGTTFSKTEGPVLCADPASAWEGGAVGAPSVHVARDGSYRLLYGANGRLGEARSNDGVSFVRTSDAPILAPRAPGGPLVPDAATDDPFDDDAVGDPHAMLGTTSDGRPLTYVYYTGKNRLGAHVIGLAARFGDDGALAANPTPVLSRFDAHGASVVRNGSVTILYAGGRSSEASATWVPSVLGAIAPATSALAPLPSDAGPDANDAAPE